MTTRDSTSTTSQQRGPIPYLARSMKWVIATTVLTLAACGSNGPLGPAGNGPTIGESVLVAECTGSDPIHVQEREGSDVTVGIPSAGCVEFEPERDPTIR